MAKSLLRHPVAVLRSILKINQPDFAKISGISQSTLTKIEALNLPLSEDNARLISHETGVSISWLLGGDPKAAPIADDLKTPFTESVYASRKLDIETGGDFSEGQERELADFMPIIIEEILLCMHSACVNGKADLIHYRIGSLVSDLKKEFGEADFKDQHVRKCMLSTLEATACLIQLPASSTTYKLVSSKKKKAPTKKPRKKSGGS